MTALMLVLALVPVVVGANAGWSVTRPARAMPPALATVLLTVFALTVALVTGMLLCLTAYVSTVSMFPALHPADWNSPYLYRECPIPAGVGLGVGLLAALLMTRALVCVVRVAAGLRRTSSVAAGLPEVAGLSIMDDETVVAYAVPGRCSRIVVSTGLLRLLDGPGRAALLAHERAHLRHRHHVYVQLARLAAAANPLMRPVSRAVDAAVERWADACAAREIGDPVVVARAVGAAALAGAGDPAGPGLAMGPGPALAAGGGDVVERVRELLEPTTRRRTVGVRLGLMIMACWASGVVVVAWVHSVVELAEIAFRTGRAT
ncbi:M56 family metallopeptidase [Kineosporia mesophila]|uniref:M56 family metallopeptidase n=1 Tax=Kineosporia mesophila TaxID=566012 RepID=A0ABP6ZU61_9ACTN|nr:M56 family metallopeptidase [Kineosporia mesophila]MCD5355105.1 M56 family metallopeptidase [Kineosporia mesophila]